MGVKITKQLKFLSLIERSTEDFKKNVNQTVAPEVLKTIEGGNNPVKAGKQTKYSQSYIDQIEGKVMFFTFKNKVVPVYPDYVESSTISINKKSGKVKKTGMKQTLGFSKGLGYGKLKSPVNLTLTGKLLNSFKTVFTEKGVRLTFTDPKADWHNEGVPSKNIPPRRLLPNHDGESFNFNISRRILDALKRALKLNL